MKYIVSQLKIIMQKRGCQVCFVLLTAYALLVSVMMAISQRGADVSNIFHPAMISALAADGDYAWFFARYYPFLAVLPAGFAFFDDKKTGMDVMLKSRMGYQSYYTSKAVAGFLASFFTFTVPFLLNILFNVMIFPVGAAKNVSNWNTYSPTYVQQAQRYLFSDLFFQNVYLHSIVHILVLGIISGCAAVFVLGISSFGMKYKVFLFLPVYLVLYLVGTFSTGTLNLDPDVYLLYCDASQNKTVLYYVSIMMGMLLAGILCIKINGKRNELS